MALAKLVCGECSAVISETDVFCPSCGAKIELGTLLTRIRPDPSPKVHKPKAREKKPRVYEPWQIISAVAVLALVATLVYSELSRDRPPAPGSPGSPNGIPPNAPAIGPPAARVDLAPLESAVKASPKDPAALLRLANAMHDNHMLPAAIEVYQRYLALRPADPDARTDLGICYFQMAQADTANSIALLQTAVKEIRRAYDGSPTHQPSAFNLGVVNLHLGDVEESNKWFRRAVELNKNSDLGVRAGNILAQHSFQ